MKRTTTTHLPNLQFGALCFYNAEVFHECGYELVRCQLSTTAVLPKEGGTVENEGRPIVLDRRTWNSMAAAAERKAA